MSDTKTPAPVHPTQPDLIELVRTLYGCTNPINEDDCDRLEMLWGELWDRIYEKERRLSTLSAENARLRAALEALVRHTTESHMCYPDCVDNARIVLASLTT